MVEYPHARSKRKAGRNCDLQTTLQQLLTLRTFMRHLKSYLFSQY